MNFESDRSCPPADGVGPWNRYGYGVERDGRTGGDHTDPIEGPGHFEAGQTDPAVSGFAGGEFEDPLDMREIDSTKVALGARDGAAATRLATARGSIESCAASSSVGQAPGLSCDISSS